VKTPKGLKGMLAKRS